MELRDYQKQLVDELKLALSQYRRVIAQLPTGGGKGCILGYLAAKSAEKGSKVLIVTHRSEIVTQDLKQAGKFGVEADIVSPKTRNVPQGLIAVGMAQTLQRRFERPEWAEYLQGLNLLIIDEAHTSEMNFLFGCLSEKCYVIGFTASPARYGQQRQLGLDYNAIVTGPSVKELVNRGFLCRCKLYSVDAPKLDDVEWDYARGDYSLGQMAAKFKSPTKYVGAVDNYERLCKGQKTIVFCCSSEQTIELTKEFNRRGIGAKYLLSKSFDDDESYSGDRDEVVAGFERGDFPVLVNFGLFVAGLDVPSIKVVMLMFSTTSVTKYLQCLGRASRPCEGKDGEFICLDFGCNFERLGRYEDDRVWGVWHKTSAGGGVAPTKECPQCHKLIPAQAQDCPFCGYHFPTQQESYQAELQEIVARKETEDLEGYVARMKLEGKKNNWILVQVCIKNPDHQKEAFMKAIDVLRNKQGENISPAYWYFFKTKILSNVKIKRNEQRNGESSGTLF